MYINLLLKYYLKQKSACQKKEKLKTFLASILRVNDYSF